MEAWIIWLIVAAILVMVEVLTQMVWTICMAVGCAAAIAVSIFGGDVAWQIAAMAAGSVVAYLVLMPWFKKWHKETDKREGRELRTGMDALLGRRATVVDEIKPGHLGRARIDGDFWQVRAPHAKETIKHGETVVVEAFDSIILTVAKI